MISTGRLERLRWPIFVVVSALAVGGGILLLLQAAPGDEGAARSLSAFPPFHATLNATSGLMLLTGYLFIRRRNRPAHIACMVAALSATLIFLGSYLYYHSQAGSVGFRGEGTIRIVYFSILISHTVLAALVAPLAATVVYRAVRGQFGDHRAVARWTLPIWLYVSVSGVLIYLMLYVWFP